MIQFSIQNIKKLKLVFNNKIIQESKLVFLVILTYYKWKNN